MKKIHKSLFAAALAFIAFSSKSQAPTPDVLHYKFNGTGSLVTNYASAPPPGTATGTIMGTQTQTGAINCMGALVGTGLSSTNEYVNTGWAPNLGSGAWSLSFWTSNIIQTTTTYYILGDVNSGGFRVFTGGVAGSGNWILRGSMTDVLLTGAASTTPCLVSFVYSPTFSNVVGYVNGVPTTTVAQSAVTLNGSGPFKVGGYSSSNSLNSGGLMADFRLYSTALTSNDILNIYNFGVSSLSLTVSGTTSVCPGQSVQINASGANSYTWSTGASSNSISVTPTTSATYSVIGSAGSCTASSSTTVNVLSAPILNVNSGSICTGSSFTITPGGASTYTFEGGNAVVSPTASSTYSVAGTGTNGCVSQAVTSSVTVNQLPNVMATSNTSLLCAGQTASLTASGALTYTWNTSATTTVVAVSPSVTSNYTVTGTDANGCSNTYTITQPVSACTGINELVYGSSLSLYPNPSSSEVIVSLNQVISELEVSDMSGRVIYKEAINKSSASLNISNYSNGIYLVKVKSNNQTEIVKLIYNPKIKKYKFKNQKVHFLI